MAPGPELSPIPEAKKRPPPITIPAPPPSRLVPGPNMLAMAERAEREEAERQAGNAFYQQAKRSADSTPKLSPVDGSHLLPLQKGSHATKDKQRISGISTFTQLIDHARGGMSPRKSGVSEHASSITSRYGSIARSRHSEHSHRSGRSTHQHNDNVMTSRAEIEGRAEKKFFKMMGHVPSTPTSETPDGVYLTTYDLSSKGSKKKLEEHVRSPKKKLFGVTLPGFMSSVTPTPSNIEPVPPMPSKAAQVLGTTPTSKRRNSPIAFKTPRSDTSKSLPSKAYDHHSHGRRPTTSGSTRAPSRAPLRKTHSPIRELPAHRVQWQGVDVCDKPEGSLDLGMPPTPPQKDTPPDDKENIGFAHIHPAFRPTATDEEDHVPRELFVDGGMIVQLPYLARTANPIPSEGGESPSKFRPYGAKDYAKLIEAERIGSARALFDYASSSVEDGNHSVPLDSKIPALKVLEKEQSADNHARHAHRLSHSLSGRLRDLPPAFYSPSSYAHSLFDEGGRPSQNTDKNRFLFAFRPKPNTTFSLTDPNHSDTDVFLEGTANLPDKCSVLSKMINAGAQECVPPHKSDEPSPSLARKPQGKGDQFSGSAGGSGYLQPEPSSSRLTDILSGVTPSKTDFNHDIFGNCPSAVPSPLHRMSIQQTPDQQLPNRQVPDQQMPSPMMTRPPSGPMGIPHSLTWAQHFHMTNEHIDVSGRTLYDFVAECNHEQMVTSSSKHDKTVAIMEERFNAIKLHLDSTNNEADRAHNQTLSINEKLDKLLEFVKVEVVEPLAVQSKRTAEMETSIKTLQKSVFDLEQLMEAKSNSTLGCGPGPAAYTQYPLPHHSSQPSLVGGLYESPNDVAQNGSSRLASIQEAANSGRFRYQNWNRSQSNVRENSKDTHHPFTAATNPYNNGASNYSGTSGGGNGYMSGYPGYVYPGTPEQSYNYTQGGPK